MLLWWANSTSICRRMATICSARASSLPCFSSSCTSFSNIFPGTRFAGPTGLWSGRDLECFRGNTSAYREAVRRAIGPFAVEVDPRPGTHYTTILVPESRACLFRYQIVKRKKVGGADVQVDRVGSVELDHVHVKAFRVGEEESGR